MAEFRIVRTVRTLESHNRIGYTVQRKFLKFFWTTEAFSWSLSYCETWIQNEIRMMKTLKALPRNMVVKTYKV